ncbi:MAG: TAXI family TRAP transporter solute-binding subunit [Paracoccaceae bacterium]|nr:TAXI family TRAP transporter solute-binding subunit [Paracoccaceae bacterium]
MFRSFKLGALVAGAIAVSAPVAQASEFINILTGGTSGVYYPLGVALSDIYAKGIEGARTQVQSTKASVENLNLLQAGKGELAFALEESGKYAWEGNTESASRRR